MFFIFYTRTNFKFSTLSTNSIHATFYFYLKIKRNVSVVFLDITKIFIIFHYAVVLLSIVHTDLSFIFKCFKIGIGIFNYLYQNTRLITVD